MNVASARIAVAFGGPSPEHDVSVLTGLQAARELRSQGREVTALYWAKTGGWYKVGTDLEPQDFVSGIPRGAEELRLNLGEGGGFAAAGGRLGRSRPLGVDLVVVCCHGGPGEDGSLQGALDLAGVSYSGPTVAGAALGMDKLAFAGVVSAAGLPCLPRRPLTVAPVGAPGQGPGPAPAGGSDASSTDETGPGFDGPYIVKPRFGGSSLGIDVVADWATARARMGTNPHLRRGAVVEPYRPELVDLNIAVRTWPDLVVSAVERPLRSAPGAEILGYADKYVGGEGMASAPRELPALLDPAVTARVKALAADVARLCEVRGVARVDFLSDGTELWVNEINTVPGSLARYLWVEPPLPFADLLYGLVAEALERPAARHSAAGADGAVLRSAGSIAAKLV